MPGETTKAKGTVNSNNDKFNKMVMQSIKELTTVVRNLSLEVDALRGKNGNENPSARDLDISNNGNTEDDKEKAAVQLNRLLFDPTPESLPGFTETSRMLMTPTSAVEAMNEFTKNMIDGKRELLSNIFIRRKDRRMLSAGRRSRFEGLAIAQGQREAEEEERSLDLSS